MYLKYDISVIKNELELIFSQFSISLKVFNRSIELLSDINEKSKISFPEDVKEVRYCDLDNDMKELGWDSIIFDSHNVCEQCLSQSLIISSFSLLERYLYLICKLYEEVIGGIKEYDSYSKDDKGMEKSTKYLINCAGLDKKVRCGKEWNVLKEWGKVRNCLTHNGGMVSKKYVNDISNIRRIVKVEEDALDYNIYVDFNNCNELLKMISRYFEIIISLVPQIS